MKKDKGFTLAEMLIVVAIIGVLVSIVSAVVVSSLEKAREAVDKANIRTAMDELQAAALDSELSSEGILKSEDGTYIYKIVYPTQTKLLWQSAENKDSYTVDVGGVSVPGRWDEHTDKSPKEWFWEIEYYLKDSGEYSMDDFKILTQGR